MCGREVDFREKKGQQGPKGFDRNGGALTALSKIKTGLPQTNGAPFFYRGRVFGGSDLSVFQGQRITRLRNVLLTPSLSHFQEKRGNAANERTQQRVVGSRVLRKASSPLFLISEDIVAVSALWAGTYHVVEFSGAT